MEAATDLRGYVGAVVRLFGMPGQFKLGETTGRRCGYHWNAVPIESDRLPNGGFSIVDSSIVEIDGQAVALRTLPLTGPALDYPYVWTMVEPTAGERRDFAALLRNVASDRRFHVIGGAA